MLLASLYANSLYASQFFRSLSIAYNEGRLYFKNELQKKEKLMNKWKNVATRFYIRQFR